jgi:UDP-GlcNAc:undecaprenyl-phosphate GlcNAc-1-phosphate transferase
MYPAGLVAGIVATLSGLLAVGVCRRIALATDFVDHPGHHKSHSAPVPYLGGVGIMLSVLAGIATAHSGDKQWVAIVGTAVLLGCVGLIDDRVSLSRLARLVTQSLAAFAAVALGVRLQLTGIEIVDGCCTILWIVLITNAVNMIDNMDGLSAGTGVVCAIGSALVIGGSAPELSALAYATAGALAAFLWWNLSTKRIFMGDAGSLFVGFLLAIISVGAGGTLSDARSPVVSLLLIMIPAADLGTVVASRWMHQLPVSLGGRDHLSHRLTSRGLSARTGVAVLWTCQAVFCLLAFMYSRGVAEVPVMFVAATIIVGLLSGTWQQSVYDEASPVAQRSGGGRLRRLGRRADSLVPALAGSALVVFGLLTLRLRPVEAPAIPPAGKAIDLAALWGHWEIAVLVASTLVIAATLSILTRGAVASQQRAQEGSDRSRDLWHQEKRASKGSDERDRAASG